MKQEGKRMINRYCDRCADRLDINTFVRVTLHGAHEAKTYDLCKVCALALIGFIEGGAAE